MLWKLRRQYAAKLNPSNIGKEPQKTLITKKVSDSATEVVVKKKYKTLKYSKYFKYKKIVAILVR